MKALFKFLCFPFVILITLLCTLFWFFPFGFFCMVDLCWGTPTTYAIACWFNDRHPFTLIEKFLDL